MTDKLERCPFCGDDENVFFEQRDIITGFCTCDNCGARGPIVTVGYGYIGDLDGEAAKAWNGRASLDRENGNALSMDREEQRCITQS